MVVMKVSITRQVVSHSEIILGKYLASWATYNVLIKPDVSILLLNCSVPNQDMAWFLCAIVRVFPGRAHARHRDIRLPKGAADSHALH